MKPQSFDQERVQLNLGRLRKGGEIFEVVVDADLAVAYKQGKDVDIREVLNAEKIFADAKKGDLSSEIRLKELFGSSEALEVAEIILKEGEIQLTSEYREKLRAEKRKKLVELIHRNAVDPKTSLPLPPTRIENAFNQANVKIDEYKKAEDQIHAVLDQLRPVLPIKFEVKTLQVHLPAEYAAKLYQAVSSYGTIQKQDWLNDGSWLCFVEVPAGLVADFYDDIGKKTQGNAEIEEKK
tara:strand:+ start:412 stop:1125 length:714 start_codon:yes stop_codon:yes gene_type:complete